MSIPAIRPLLAATLLAGAAVGPAAAETVAIKTGTLIDGTGGPPVRGATILVEDGRIAAVGKDVEAPAAPA